ncbi:hypothetical protein M8997_013620 [Phyllobacterium sp. 21LDTY02-6]|jgi:hypothetical protein|nr:MULTISPECIES: hypothetical protein [unclassified Phyllobacterium]MCO4318228.1 hypothetical protein [Phyllobacterium sp. 21LDTY02-6]MCX8280223.1 hypothetical protein [Phyllobacterium sp. 0TCS1.6C]MCX8294216.1 hypothetical protein [Phyllobacterium sp. 0TCS1.6A]
MLGVPNGEDDKPDYGPYLTRLWPYMIAFIVLAAAAMYLGRLIASF